MKYYIEYPRGTMRIIEAKDFNDAVYEIVSRLGIYIRQATQEDIEEYIQCGGILEE